MEVVAAAYEEAGVLDAGERVTTAYLAKHFTRWGGPEQVRLQGGIKWRDEQLLSADAELPDPFKLRDGYSCCGGQQPVAPEEMLR